MEINVQSVEQVTVVELSGELDATTTPTVTAQVLPLAKIQPRILLDMEDVTYMSSAGLRLLLLLHRQIAATHGQIVLSGLTEEVKDTMAMTGFLEFFTTCDDRASALQALQNH
jgi:anti-sigma B factor antagonist